jgi:4'-phosphopantetheinyl transferase
MVAARDTEVAEGVKEVRAALRRVTLARTPEKRPMVVRTPGAPHLEVNASHHGHLIVAVAAEADVRLGVDVMDVEIPARTTQEEFFRDLRDCFTAHEWRQIRGNADPAATFFTMWALKESYIKAVGIGLGFDLQRAEFSVAPDGRGATATVDGKPLAGWTFTITRARQHVVALAIAPPAAPTKTGEKWDFFGSKGWTPPSLPGLTGDSASFDVVDAADVARWVVRGESHRSSA